MRSRWRIGVHSDAPHACNSDAIRRIWRPNSDAPDLRKEGQDADAPLQRRDRPDHQDRGPREDAGAAPNAPLGESPFIEPDRPRGWLSGAAVGSATASGP